MEEIWKDIEGYEGYYKISNLGNIKSEERVIEHNGCYGGYYKIRGKILKPKIDKDGYFKICLKKNDIKKYFFIHRLVAQTFIPNPNNLPQVNHKDETKQNNCVSNLEWCDNIYNVNYGTGIRRRIKTVSKPINQYDLCGTLIKTWDCINDAVRFYNNNTQICACCRGRRKMACGYKWSYANK